MLLRGGSGSEGARCVGYGECTGSPCHSKSRECIKGRWKFDHSTSTEYGGQRNAAPLIVKALPDKPIFVEPFAGHAYVAQRLWKDPTVEKVVLGDINCDATEWIKKSRKVPPNTIIKCPQDWKKTVAQTDSKDTLTFFDPPWEATGGKLLREVQRSLPQGRNDRIGHREGEGLKRPSGDNTQGYARIQEDALQEAVYVQAHPRNDERIWGQGAFQGTSGIKKMI